MSEQRFPVGEQAELQIIRSEGDIRIRVHDENAIVIRSDESVGRSSFENDTLLLETVVDDIQLLVPSYTKVSIELCQGDLSIEGVRSVELSRIHGDATLRDLGEITTIGQIDGDAEIVNVPRLVGHSAFKGSLSLEQVGQVELNHVAGDLDVDKVDSLVFKHVSGDLTIKECGEHLALGSVSGDLSITTNRPASLMFGSVGGDFTVEGATTEVHGGSVGGDLRLAGQADDVAVGSVGGDLQLIEARTVRISSTGGDATIQKVGEQIQLGTVGGDCTLKEVGGSAEIGNVRGDLSIKGEFPVGSNSKAVVHGDVTLTLPEQANVTLLAAVSGHVRGLSVINGPGQQRLNVRYGNGDAHVNLQVHGDLIIRSSDAAKTQTTSQYDFDQDMGDFNREFKNFGLEMGQLGQELGRFGKELANEISAAFLQEGGQKGAAWAETVTRKVEQAAQRMQQKAEEQARAAEERVRATEERVRAAEERARLRVKINDREWQLDPERLERIREQAKRAAAEGLTGAFAAVERALSRINVPVPPAPPAPPAPSTSPVPPAPPAPPAPSTSPVPPAPPAPYAATGQTIRINIETPDATEKAAPAKPAASPAPATESTAVNLEQEREAILRMIAEGRISPEEGDLLLESLG